MAFRAYLTYTFTRAEGVDSTIPFDDVQLNVGGGYNPATSHFTAPVSGIYSISYAVLAYSGAMYTYVGLYVNNTKV